MSALNRTALYGGFMAEIRVAPQRRTRAVVWVAVAAIVAAAAAWYFLAGSGAGV